MHVVRNLICQQRIVISRPFSTGGSHRPFDTVNIDTIGPFESDPFGRKYAVIIVDTFSRFMTAYPVLDTTAKSAAEAMVLHAGLFGTPEEILHDGGPEYDNQLMEEYCKMTGSRHCTTLAHSHQENSLVERTNKEVNRWLRDIMYELRRPKDQWSSALPFAQRIHNNSIIATIGYAPTEIVMSKAVMTDPGIFDKEKITMEKQLDQFDEFMKKNISMQEDVIAAAQKNQRQHTADHIRNSNPSAITQYVPGDYVLLAWPVTRFAPNGRPSRLDPIYRGPYKIIAGQDDRYKLLDIVHGKQLPDKHVSMLKRFYYDSSRTNPIEVAMQDKQDVFLVEEITDHVGNFSRRKTLQFKVKWLGYKEITWEPWTNIKDTSALIEYLNLKGLQRYAPRKLVSTEEDLLDSEPQVEDV